MDNGSLVLNWLFYRPASGDKVARADVNPCQEYWGETYAPELKRQLLQPVFNELEAKEQIGNLIIDIGSGAFPVTRLLRIKPGRKRLCVDIAADNGESVDELRIRLDAEVVGRLSALSLRKTLLRVCSFLKIDPRREVSVARADLIVVSETGARFRPL